MERVVALLRLFTWILSFLGVGYGSVCDGIGSWGIFCSIISYNKRLETMKCRLVRN